MFSKNKIKKAILAIGDFALLYLGLYATLAIRYGSSLSDEIKIAHQLPFAIIYAIWIVVFYILGLYDIEKIISLESLANRLFKSLLTAGVVSIIIFYTVPYFIIAPKTNLALNLIVSFSFLWVWREIFFNIIHRYSTSRVVFLDSTKEMDEFSDFLNTTRSFGLEIIRVSSSNLDSILKSSRNGVVVVSRETKENKELIKKLYGMLKFGLSIIDFDKFYEDVAGKIPVSLINEVWFLENLSESGKQRFEKIKRVLDIVFALLVLPIFLVLLPFVSLSIKLNSSGPIFYKQKRIGKNGKIFEITKFRSMVHNAEKNGAQWAEKDDSRVTFIGSILRKTRIDEIPQVFSVLAGNLSFVGPRPERPEFVEELAQKIPHYSMRQMIKPGLTGWAQINFPYGATVEDAMEKLQYDLYYIKNRSLILEFVILLKTIAVILRREGR